MSRSLRRGGIAAIAALAIASLSSCAAGNTPETLEVKPDNASATLGTDIRLNNIVVVTADESSGEHTGPANVTVNISNSGTEALELQSVTVGDGATATFADDKGAALPAIVVPAGGAVLLGGPGGPTARIASTTVSVGGYVPASFGFRNHEKLEAEAQVSPNKGLYKGFGPTAAPAAVPPKATAPATGATTPAAPAAGTTAPAAH
ncbi:DUF461 domain-containing protein [Kitasatospora purpeofusca]|uniref:DUF461 domain-containing protein n=1 Tax=Kitasatospora purpeofusca TaxID=67352 RepID=UPI002A59A147|nr:DUF461 domain-containing protein [Kitasatospora purpeofusca]MDY0811992.1 DUF461 domain-containing protein [Kitasatospora purpeofusca]